MQLQERQHYSSEDYLTLEKTSEFRNEYLAGQIIPMAGGSPEHNQMGA